MCFSWTSRFRSRPGVHGVVSRSSPTSSRPSPVIIVTYYMQQATRVADDTIFMLDGEVVEAGPTDVIFNRPSDKRAEDYVTGRFG